MQELAGWNLANAVTGFATVFAGGLTVALSLLVGGQPTRWVVAYGFIFVTGIPTVGFHGFGEPFHAASFDVWRVSDTGSNLLLAWALQLAALGDSFPRATQIRVACLSGVLNLAAIGWMIAESFLPERGYALALGRFGGFNPGELMLIADSLFVAFLLWRARASAPANARRVLALTTLIFLVGLGLATGRNDTVHATVVAYHALWHLVGAFGFLALWVYNQLRFAEARG